MRYSIHTYIITLLRTCNRANIKILSQSESRQYCKNIISKGKKVGSKKRNEIPAKR